MRRTFVTNAKRIATIILLIVTVVCFGLGIWAWQIDQEVATKLEQKNFLPPLEFYASPEAFRTGSSLDIAAFRQRVFKKNYRERSEGQNLHPMDFSLIGLASCQNLLGAYLPNETSQCLLFVTGTQDKSQEGPLSLIALSANSEIVGTFAGNPPTPKFQVELEPEIFAQYLGSEPVFQRKLSLGEIPPMCLNAVLSIEDPKFLEHGGISLTGILRAFVTNILKGRSAQGGSTITQQLVKNYFLTPEKTIKRKVIEAMMSLVLEFRATKDQILETYLNIIYLGQSGPFQIRGFGAASQYYFSKNVSDLELHECAMLATVLNSPGLWSPFTKPENAKKRRELVLSKMRDQGFINEEEFKVAINQPLPKKESLSLNETAPYFVDAALKQLAKNGVDREQGLKIYTTLSLQAQASAQAAVTNHLAYLEANNKKIMAQKEKGQLLEGLILAGDPKTGEIAALVGGRSFKKTQFNRAIDAHRQIGSIMKPLVYLTALENISPNGEPYNPITLIEDAKFTFKLDRKKTWSPENYEKKFYGSIPLFYALKNSLNASTAQLGINVGIEKIIDTARRLGIQSNLDPVPSLTLGAFEIYPIEVIRAYMAMANLGHLPEVSFVRHAKTVEGDIVYEFSPESVEAIDSGIMSELVGMMKQTVLSGTAQFITASGFSHPAAGKTGTTSDNRDAWFAGYTPYHVAVSWVGFDNNAVTGLTGASGAVPIWLSYMKGYGSQFPADDFAWPETTEIRKLNEVDLKSLGAIQDENDPLEIELVFKKE
ncbi:MAG: transglycosylase domain-containing protein [Pseudobdellovibrionaceae bacterium]